MYPELIQFFGKWGTNTFGRQLQPLKELCEKSNLSIIYETYIGQLFFYCFISLNIFLSYFLYLFLVFWKFSFLSAIASAIILTLTLTFIIATAFYLYPFSRYQQQKESLERNMVFGISYMNIISKSGVPLQNIIYSTSREKGLGEFSEEFERAHKYICFTGKDIVSSLREVANRTPSKRFKDFVEGLIAAILSGSNVNKYLSEETKKEIGNYREKGRKYTSIMSVFADVYIVFLLIAPLCVVSILSIFSLMDSSFMGVEISIITTSIVYLLLPALGIIYLLVLSRFKI